MSSLFKNPNYVLTVLGSSSNHERNHVVTVNSGLAQFDHAQSNSKKWPICPEQFFFVQTIIITLIYLLALFIAQNLKKF